MIIRLLCVNFYFNPKIRESKERTNDLDKTNIMINRMMFDDNNDYIVCLCWAILTTAKCKKKIITIKKRFIINIICWIFRHISCLNNYLWSMLNIEWVYVSFRLCSCGFSLELKRRDIMRKYLFLTIVRWSLDNGLMVFWKE